MYKNLAVLVLLVLNLSFCYAQLKDAHLIQNKNYKKINSFILKKKIYKDEKRYQKYKKILTNEEYDIYKIAEKIIRANNLQYKNHRISFHVDKYSINAISSNSNLILINSSLYDCLHQNKDAIAFAIAHELSHLILSHHKETIENTYKIKKIEENLEKLNSQKLYENYSKNLKNLITNIYITQRKLELEADSLALELITKAGYDYNKAIELFDYLEDDYNYFEGKNTYPLIYERKDNLKEEYEILNIKNLKLEGENNLISNSILSVQKSLDKETLIINKPDNYKDYSFNPKNKEQKFLEKAYDYYLQKDNKKAIYYFEKAQEINPNNYVSLLYLSYCHEQENNIKLAKKYIKKAHKLNPKEENINKQYKTFYKR